MLALVPGVSQHDTSFSDPAAVMVKGFLHVGDGSRYAGHLDFQQISRLAVDEAAPTYALGQTGKFRWVGVGLGRIVVSEIYIPNLSVNPVYTVVQSDNATEP